MFIVRKKGKEDVDGGQAAAALVPVKTACYKAALYARLSEETKANRERATVETQMELLRKFVAENDDMVIFKEYADISYSGTNFERPGFEEMIKDMRSGLLNCIVVKDFSRFGRDYLEVGRFLEYIFPILKIRFISVNDGYDSDDKFGTTGGMSVALKNLVYGMYSADLSKKVRSARDTRVRNGEFVGQFAPYGYMKNPEDKHELLVDEDAAWVVRKIFRMAADGVSHTEIARQLNEGGIPTRYMYHQLKGDNFPDKQPHVKVKLWDNSAVRDIITDETYLGTMFWNRAKCGMDTNKKRIEQPKERWIIVENQHEALISKELFQKAKDNIVGRDMSNRTTGKKKLFFICGCCGKGLKLRSRKKDRYYCGSRIQQIENDCQKINVMKKELEDAVLCQVRGMADMLAEERSIRNKAEKSGR